MTFERGARFAKYEIGQKLGAGGFGILYAARDTELQRDVAIKLLRPEHAFKEQVVQRFLQEARAAARIHHPGIVTVYESGEVTGTYTRNDGSVYIAMELLVGETLSQRIKTAGRLPVGIAIAYCRQMADALAAAHTAGIIHRDLKPQNVFLVRDAAVAGGERVKVLDFGIAKLADGLGGNLQTHSLVMLGTPMYMSPEQCKSSAKVDARSDIYSLGCILFEMLTGRTPFDGDSGELIAKHQLIAPPRAKAILHDVPDELDALVGSMLAKSADERPQTMTAVIDVLDAIEERLAPAPGTGEQATLETSVRALPAPVPFYRRMPIVTGAAIAVALGVCGGLVATRGGSTSPTPPASANAEALATADATTETAPPAVVVAPDAGTAEPALAVEGLAIECQKFVNDRDWPACIACGDKLPDPAKAAAVHATCSSELENATTFAKLKEAFIARKNELATSLLDDIEPTSVYRREGELLVDVLPAVAVKSGGKRTPTAPTGCDAEAMKDKGMAFISQGQHAAALAQFEASLRCADDPYVRTLAFMEACASNNSPKATLYYDKITPEQQRKFGPVCDRQKPPVAYRAASVEPTAATSPPAGCDANALKDKGMEAINAGQHAAALAHFEAALRCNDDMYVRQLAFMEACASQNSAKAKTYYKRLTPAQRDKFAQICIRQKPSVRYE